MSARHTTTPLNTNGIEITTHVPTTDATPGTVNSGVKWIESWMAKHTTTDTPNSSEYSQSWRRTPSGGKRWGRRWTTSAPTVMPNRATEIATKAKWYHIVTLKIRVRAISSMSVESVTRKRPA